MKYKFAVACLALAAVLLAGLAYYQLTKPGFEIEPDTSSSIAREAVDQTREAIDQTKECIVVAQESQSIARECFDLLEDSKDSLRACLMECPR